MIPGSTASAVHIAGGGGGGLTITSPVAPWLRSAGAASASFSVVSGDLLVLGMGQWTGTMTAPTNSGTAFTWTQRSPAAGGGRVIEHCFYTAPVTATQSMTVTLAAGGGSDTWGLIWVVSGQNASPIGVGGAGPANDGTNAPNQSYTTTAAGSATFVSASDFQELGTPTSSNLLDINTGDYSGIVDAIWGYRANAASGATSYNLDAAGAGGAGWNSSYLEILPA